MKNLSRRMKRLLAILLVETIVAVNVISGYASESDGVYTISEAEVEAELQESGNEPVVTQEEVLDDSQDSYEESYEEQEPQQEDQNVSEGEEGASDENTDSEEQPVAEEPSLSEDENNEEQTDGETEEQEPEEQECICTIECQYDDFEYINKDCPICAKAIDIEDDEQREQYLAKKCEVLKEKLAHATPTPTIAPTATIMPTATVASTATIAPTETPKETNKPEETSAPETTVSAAPTESASPSDVPEATPSADPGESPDVSLSELPNGTPEIEPSVSPSAVSSASPSMIPSASPSESPLKEESGVVTLKSKVTQKASRWIFSKTVNMSYTITVENTSDTDATDVCVEAAIPSIITINHSNTEWIIHSLPAGEKAEISFDGYINENTDNVDSLMGRFYINGEKIEDVSFDGEWRLIESDSTEGPTSISTSCDGVTINVSAADGSILPAGVEVKATRISADSAVNLIEQSQGVEVLDAMAFDIVLVVDGQEVQPDGSVVVTFTDIPLASEDYAVAVAHIGDGGIENIGTGDKSSVSVEADHFSEYVLYTIKKVNGSYVPSNGVTTKDNENMACFDFHIFANYYSGNYNGHVNGNFAIRNIEGDTMATFGLNNGDKVSENQQICYVENMSAWNETVKNYSHTTFVFGPGIELKVYGSDIYAVQNGKEFCIGSYASMKNQVFTSDTPYVDFMEEFRKAEAYSKELSEKENDAETSITGDNNHRYIDSASDADEVYIAMKPGDLGIKMDFNASKAGQKFIINMVVDGDEFTWNSNGISYKVNGVGDIGNSESHAFYAGNIIWNFVKPDGSPFDGNITLTGTWLGTIMAPKAMVNFTVVNGSVIADRVYKSDGESHKGTYTTTKADYTVYKSWSGGTNRPDVNISLYRRIRNADSSFVAASIDRNNLSDTSAYELSGTATIRCSAGESSYTFAKLPSSDEYGYTNEYFVVEEPTPGYEASYNGPLSIVNEHVQQETGGITLNKTNQFGTAIEGVVFGIYSDEAATVKVGEMITNASGTASYAELEPGSYYVKEISAPEGYQISDTVYSVVVKANEVARVNGGEAIVNEQKMGGLTLKKVNETGENLAGAVFTIYSDADTTTVVGTMTTDAEGNASCNDLAAGVYYVKETSAPEGYKLNPVIYTVVVTADSITAVNDGNAIVNEENDQYTDYSVNKIWAGSLKKAVTVQLMRNGEPAAEVNDYRVTLGADREQSYTWSHLLSKSNGITYTYSVAEIDSNGNVYKDGDLTGDSCRVSYATSESSTTITNTYETIQISGNKIWDDNNNQDGARPKTIRINLLANGEVTETKEIGPDVDGNWNYSFTNLPKYKNGAEIVYTVTEDEVENYTSKVEGYNITNQHTPNKTSHSVEKVWVDSDNQDGIRPGSIKVVLLADGEVVTGSEETLNESNSWKYTWTGLAEKKNGKKICYTAKEVDDVSGYAVSSVTSGATTVITNTHEIEKINIGGSKTWNDNNDQDGLRKKIKGIIIRLWKGEQEVANQTVTATNGWKWEFDNLPKYENGAEIEYFITEDKVEGYDTSYDGYNVINTHTPETTEVSGSKTWDDNDNQDGARPKFITINLFANGTGIQTIEVRPDADGNWNYSFTDLPKYENGVEIEYTITEDKVKDYTTSVDGYNVTNKHTPGKTSHSVTKVWLDNSNQDGKRPASIRVALFADGDKVVNSEVSLNEANNWSYSWSDLPEKKAGKVIVYTAKEIGEISGYTVSTSEIGSATTITNTYETETVDISGSKVWNDKDDQDGLRAKIESITIRLWNGQKPVAEQTVTGPYWTWSFNDLPKYEDGKLINYTITEDEVEGYTSSIDGYNVTNTHIPDTVEISGSKTWDDNNNQDGIRPDKIMINLLANGTGIQSKEVKPDADGNWNYSFTNLPKYENGIEIEYKITEDVVKGYTTKVEGYNVTNTHTPETTEVSGSKIWDDKDDQDGLRANIESITIHLWNGQKPVAEQTVTGPDWTWNFNDLPKYEDGKLINYTITEEKVSGYDAAINGYDVTNTHIPETVEISGSKTWNDANNQDGKRPDSITINLLANGKPVDSKTVKAGADGNWNYSFTDLPKYAAGNEIVYTVTEDAVENYSTKIDGYNITNSYTPSKTSVSVTKAWDDANNQDGKRSSRIMVQLYADGNASGEPVELNESNNWTYTWSELPKMKAGQPIKYTVDEVDESGQSYTPDEYTKKITGDAEQGFIITNTYIPQTTSISGSKIWDDANNQDGKRPTSITVKLLANGTAIKTISVTPDTAGKWNYSFTDLPVYEKGEKITYTVEEEAVAGYVATINGTTITNKYIPEKTSISGSKTWDDANNQDGKRPAKITVTLLANGVPTASKEVTADDNWWFSFENLPKYANGEKITYTIQETSVSNYTTVITGDAANGFTIKNSYTPGKTNVEGVKTWNDANNQDGKRPVSITINLLADGEKIDSKKITAQDGWKWNFTNLPEYKNGKKITYTITEDPVENYVTTVNGYNVTNTHTPELVDFSGVKTWNDANNQDGMRPSSITIRLLANGEEVRIQEVTAANNWSWEFKGLPKYKDGHEIGYTITEDAVPGYTSKVNGLDVTNSHTPETVDISGTKTWNDNDDQDGIRPDKITINLLADGEKIKSVTVGSADGWSWSFTDLPKYANGREIRYTITEDVVKDYSSEITKTSDYVYKVVNNYTPGKTSKTVTKIWNDKNDQDGIRPTSIRVVLLANGQKANVADAEVTLNASNNWTYTWSGLDLKANKKTIEYTVQEIGTIEGYNTSYSKDTFTITNTHTPAEVYVEGTKTWQDNNNQDGIRPASIIVKLYADGELKDSKEVTAADGWSWKFDHLPKFKNVDGRAVKIQYSVQEEAVTGYDTTYPAGSFDIVNSHTTEKISLDGMKKWEDNNDQDGIRPDSVTMKLLADGKDTGKTAIASKANGWKYSFTNLDKYKENGTEIKYTVEEAAVEGYTTTVNGTIVTNSHIPEKTSLEGTKVWDDADNRDGKRPESITINLFANGQKVASKTLTADTNQGNIWNWSFTDLDKKKDGKDIVYTVTEDVVMGYATTISGTTITNTYRPEVTQISGTKTWLDSNNQDHKRPDSITINLLADGKIKLSTTTNATANWAYSFTDLPVYENGTKIIYTIQEVVPEGYTVSYDGNNITNRYDPEKTSVNGVKTWNDNNNQDGIRPQSITVHLYADGVDTGKEVTTDELKNWKYSFEDLDKYKDGVEIVYTVVEDQVKDYTTSIDGYNITNTHTPETIDVSGSKTWNDAENQDNVRPAKIMIRLYADGKEIQHREVTASENWKWSFTDLPKYADGAEIVYTISEDPVDDYTTEVKDYDVTNTHKPAVVEIQGIKTWNDNDDQDGKRPTEIIVRLYADGTEVDSRTVTERSGWIYRFTNLPKYAAGQQGHEIVYTVREDVVEGYSTEYTEGSYDITNRYTPEETSRTVTKVWEDNNNQDGLRPASIMVQLMADKKPYGDPVELNEANNWTYTWTKLPVKEKKKEITYKVEEISKIEGYDTTYSDDTFIITNTHKPAEVFVEGTKTWDDNDNQDGLRPTSITINLFADGEQIDSMVVTPAADGTWSWRFDNLPKFRNANGTVTKIQYSIEEIKVDGYESRKDYTNDRFNLINTHKPETVDLSGSKTWNDNDNADGSRPSSIKISLLADGAVVAEKTVTEADGWSWSFKDLPKYADGKEIRYTVSEDVVDGYTTSYSEDGLSVINSYTPEFTGRSVVKIWDDSSNADQLRPVSIQVQLLADGAAYGDVITLSDGNNWSYTWSDLPAKKNGQYISYTVQEITNVNGYTVSISESGTVFTIVNYHPVTPPPTPTPTPTPTPSTPVVTPSAPTPTPPTGEVLGARRGGAVLGARRGLDQAVLGKRRRPSTGDSAAMIIWVIALFGAMGGAAASIVGLKKKDDKK